MVEKDMFYLYNPDFMINDDDSLNLFKNLIDAINDARAKKVLPT